MKKRILSIVLMLALAFSLAIGTAVVSSAADGDASLALNLAENITVQVKFKGWANKAVSADVKIGDRSAKQVVPVVSGNDAVVEVAIPVKDLDTDVAVTVYDADGEVIAEKTVNGAEYCATLAGDATYGALVAALEAYSAAAKNYFAGAEVDAPATAPDFGESTVKFSGTVPTGLTHYSATLLLESETTIRHYFTLADGKNLSSYRFWVDLDEDGGYDKDEEIVPFANGNYYCVDISGITPNDIDKQFTVFVTDFTNTYSCTYGALDYAVRAYNKEGAANYVKALAAALNNYLAEAAKIGANIIFMDGDSELKTELYNYGVDNYISYAAEKAGSLFAGWVDADGNKVNCIPAGSEGDVTLYATWESAPATPAFSASSDNVISTIASTLGATTTTTEDGATVLNVASYATKRFNYPTVNGQNFAPAFASVSTYKYAKAELEFGMVDGKALIPFNMRILGEQQFFNIAADGAVYLGGSQDAKYKIAQLENGVLTPVEFYMDLTGCDFTFTNSNTVVLHATNVAGDAVSITYSGTWNSARTGIGQIMLDLDAHKALEGQECGIMMGNMEWLAVPMMGDITVNSITDATTGAVVSSYEPAQATRLPMNTVVSGKAFAGWYADAECTQAINSISAGNFGPLTVYSKWIDADYYASSKNANGNHIEGNSKDFNNIGDIIEEYNMCYTYTVRFDKNSSTGVSGQIRLRNSGLETIVDDQGNVTYKDWAKYYQYYSTDPARAGLGNEGNKYVGDVFDGILEELGIELRAKNDQGEYIKEGTYTVTVQQQKVEDGEPVVDENGEPVMEDVEVEKPIYKIDEEAFDAYYAKLFIYNPNSNAIYAIRYAKGIVKTMNNKVLANVTKEDAVISFVVDFANLELRYYLNGEFITKEALTARTPDTPFDADNNNYNVFLDADGGLSNYNNYTSAEPFRFLNWQNTSGATLATEAFTFGDIYDTTANVEYVTNGGVIDGDAATDATVGKALVLPEISKENCLFVGWFLDASFETSANGYVVPDTKNITLYAKFVDAQTIVYNENGGTINDAEYSTIFYPGYTEVVLPTDVTKDGGEMFVGWFMDENFTVKATSELINAKTETVNLYANFLAPKGITYNANGGTINDAEYSNVYFPGYADVDLPWVEKSGAIFAGWYFDNTFTVKATNEAFNEADGDVTLYALYVDSYWSKGAAIGNSEYWWGQEKGGWSGGNIADAMIAAGVDTLTLRVDTATTGSENWVGAGVRLRPATGGGEAYVINFANGNMTSLNSGTVLTTPNTGDVVDVVIDFTNKTCTYYVNGQFVVKDTGASMGDLANYNYESVPGVATLTRGNMFQLTSNSSNGRKLAYDGISFIFGDIYNHVDADGDHICDDCGLKEITDCYDAVGDGDHNCDACGKIDISECVETGTDFICDDCGAEIDATDITYNENGGTIVSTGYTEKYIPGAMTVTLPNMVTKDGALFTGWYLDAELTQKVTAEALAAAESDVNLYAKFVSNTVADTKAANTELENGIVAPAALNFESTYLSSSADKALTIRYVLEKVADPSSIENSVNVFRVRDNLGKHQVNPIYVSNGTFYAGSSTSDPVLASNRSDREVVIDIVMDFDAKSLTYYVDYEKVHTASAGFADLGTGLYDYAAAPTYKSFYQWFTVYGNLHHTVSIIYGDIHHLDSNNDHLCDDCGVRLTDCVDAAGDGDHDCDECGAANASACTDENSDGMCDECGFALDLPEITYEVNGGTISTIGYSTKIFPNTEVVLPWVTKSGASFVAWYLDEALTQKATQEALAAATEDVTLYAKYATPLGSGTVSGHGAAITLKDYSTMWANDASLGYSVTHRIVLNSATEGNEIRCRNQANAYYVQEVWLCADGVYATKNGVKVGDFGDVVDVVMDFDDKTITYYCNGVLVEEATRTGIEFADATTYDFLTNKGNVFCQFNRQDQSGATSFTYETFAGNING